MLPLFGSTYVCEQTCSVMNINKASNRSKLTDQHLTSILKISTTKLQTLMCWIKRETNNNVPTDTRNRFLRYVTLKMHFEKMISSISHPELVVQKVVQYVICSIICSIDDVQ